MGKARESGQRRVIMPAESKAQYRFMRAICSGIARKKPKGLSRKEACEYVAGQSPKGLPEKKKRK